MEKLVYEVCPTGPFAADCLHEWYSEELEKSDGKGQSRFLSEQEFQDFYEWTCEFDIDCHINWAGKSADYKVFENGEQIEIVEKY